MWSPSANGGMRPPRKTNRFSAAGFVARPIVCGALDCRTAIAVRNDEDHGAQEPTAPPSPSGLTRGSMRYPPKDGCPDQVQARRSRLRAAFPNPHGEPVEPRGFQHRTCRPSFDRLRMRMVRVATGGCGAILSPPRRHPRAGGDPVRRVGGARKPCAGRTARCWIPVFTGMTLWVWNVPKPSW